jgi:glucose-1-phosphate cytidylyltransferase
MKAVILAGGLGTRITEETVDRPKPMIEVGGRPLLWHIMKTYSAHGINEFVICLGYKGYMIKEYFMNYYQHNSDLVIDLAAGATSVLKTSVEKWKITLVDTGIDSMTGGRIKRIRPYLNDESFCLTYGDGLSDIDISKSLAFHRDHKRMATVTAVRPPGRFGILELDEKSYVSSFSEKPINEVGWINGGFFVLEQGVFDYIDNNQTVWEKDPLERLSQDNQLAAFQHSGYWQPCDTVRDLKTLENDWDGGNGPWCHKENI